MFQVTVRILSLLLFSAATISAAQEFSADIFPTSKNNADSGKIYVSNDKLRFESKERGGRGGIVIVNFVTHTTDILMPEQKMYMEMAQGQDSPGGAQRAFSFFRPPDVENACGEWQRLARKPGGSCSKTGDEMVNGRKTIKYEGKSADGDVSHIWLDSKLKFGVKWEGKDGSGELRDIQEGAQPAGLFQIPADYTKMDMGSMMQQHMPPH